MEMTDYVKWCNFYYIITTLSWIIQTEAQPYNITALASSTESGTRFTYTCQTDPIQVAVKWTETSWDNTTSIYSYYFSAGSCIKSTGTPSPPDYVFDCDATGTFTVSFNLTFERHEGSKWKCGSAAGPTPESYVSVLNVTVTLTSLSVGISPGPVVTEGTSVTLSCSTNPCSPVPQMIWMKDGNEHQDPSINQTDTRKTTGFVGESKISKEVSVSDRGSYSCKAVYGSQTIFSTNSIILDVQDCECKIICIVLAVLIGIVGCGCEVAAIVAIVIVYCMFQLITGTLIYELPGTPDRKKLKEKLQHGLKKLEVNHTTDGNRLTITLKNAAFNETELTCLIRNLKTIEMIVREKVFPAWAKYVILSAGLLGFLLGVIGIILQQVLCCLEECLALLILAIIALVIGVVVIIIWIAWVRTWIFYKRKKSRPEAGDSPIPLTGSQIHTTPSEKKTPRGEPPKKMLEQKVRSIDELKEIKKKPPPVFKGNGQSQNNPREPSPISQSDSVASSSDVAVHPGKTKVTPTNEPVRM